MVSAAVATSSNMKASQSVTSRSSGYCANTTATYGRTAIWYLDRKFYLIINPKRAFCEKLFYIIKKSIFLRYSFCIMKKNITAYFAFFDYWFARSIFV